jgi:hypothetical protein
MDDKEAKDLLAYAFKKGIIDEQSYLIGTHDPVHSKAVQWRLREAAKVNDLVIEQARKLREEDIKKVEEENRIARLKAASQMGVSVEVYEQIMLKQAGSRAEVDIEAERAERLAQIEANKVRIMNDDKAEREVRLALLASIHEAAKQYYELRARKAPKIEIDNAKCHLDDLQQRLNKLEGRGGWGGQRTGTNYGKRY